MLELPEDVDAQNVVTQAARESVDIANPAGSVHEPSRSRSGLVLGYGNLSDTSVGEAVTRLAAAYPRA